MATDVSVPATCSRGSIIKPCPNCTSSTPSTLTVKFGGTISDGTNCSQCSSMLATHTVQINGACAWRGTFGLPCNLRIEVYLQLATTSPFDLEWVIEVINNSSGQVQATFRHDLGTTSAINCSANYNSFTLDSGSSSDQCIWTSVTAELNP